MLGDAHCLCPDPEVRFGRANAPFGRIAKSQGRTNIPSVAVPDLMFLNERRL
jgi:hypothetical protein